MVSWKCRGCERTNFVDRRGVKNHRKNCKHYKKWAARALATGEVEDTDSADSRSGDDTSGAEQQQKCGATGFDNDERIPLPQFVEGSSSGGIAQDNMAGDGVGMDVEPEHPGDPPPTIWPSGRPRRHAALPSQYRDEPPQPIRIEREADTDSPQPGTPVDKPLGFTPYVTEPNQWGVRREYPFGRPSYVPDVLLETKDLTNPLFFPSHHPSVGPPSHLPSVKTGAEPYEPFTNWSSWQIMDWHFANSSVRSLDGLNDLVRHLKNPNFDVSELDGFNAGKEAERLDRYEAGEVNIHFPPGWEERTVELPLPAVGAKNTENTAPTYTLPEVHIRPLVDVIRSALQEPSAEHFHLFPFREIWEPPGDGGPRHIFNEIYNSEAWITEHHVVAQQAARDGCPYEVVIIGISLWSDGTHLTQFGSASLWPIYLYIANESKYIRGRPNAFSAHHIAYIPKLDKDFEVFYENIFKKRVPKEVIGHVKKELVHAIWTLLLDNPEFLKAYVHGCDTVFWDGVVRRWFPRFFTYAMDYVEKVLLACVKFLAKCPCPVCLVEKKDVPDLGTDQQTAFCASHPRTDNHPHRMEVESARRMLFGGLSLKNKRYQAIFHNHSYTPNRNAFSAALHEHGFDYFRIIMPDLLHEFELGVWKSVFTHLIRILNVVGDSALGELDKRYRAITPFGRDTIRRFPKNVSAMHKLAARDFEDLLQCALPVFDGLIPKVKGKKNSSKGNNTIIQHLIFELATWHGLAKLRMHDEVTTNELRASTKRLGSILRIFERYTCNDFATKDLPKEAKAKARRLAAATAATSTSVTKSRGKKRKTTQQDKDEPEESESFHTFNMFTYKLHSLTHYADAIERVGTTDNFNSQTGELQHHHVKALLYPRASKKNLVTGIGKQHLRYRRVNIICQRVEKMRKTGGSKSKSPIFVETLPEKDPSVHYQMSHEVRAENRVSFPAFLQEHKDDPATQDLMRRLKTHLLWRLLNKRFDGDDMTFTVEELNHVVILGNCFYTHAVLRINYTSYNGLREQDTITIRNRPFVMLLAGEGEAHPYWYAQVIGIWHIRVAYQDPKSWTGRRPRDMDVLWIRWLGPTEGHQGGWAKKKLHRLGFVDINDTIDNSDAFGFLDPDTIIRGVHLIPAFRHGHTNNGLAGKSLGRPNSEHDWKYLDVNMFVDRDMLMRYRGGGIGHHSTHKVTRVFLDDRDPGDKEMVRKRSKFAPYNIPIQTDETMDVDNSGEEGGNGEKELVGDDGRPEEWEGGAEDEEGSDQEGEDSDGEVGLEVEEWEEEGEDEWEDEDEDDIDDIDDDILLATL